MLFFKWGIFLIFTKYTFNKMKFLLTLGFKLANSCVANTSCCTATGLVIFGSRGQPQPSSESPARAGSCRQHRPTSWTRPWWSGRSGWPSTSWAASSSQMRRCRHCRWMTSVHRTDSRGQKFRPETLSLSFGLNHNKSWESCTCFPNTWCTNCNNLSESAKISGTLPKFHLFTNGAKSTFWELKNIFWQG